MWNKCVKWTNISNKKGMRQKDSDFTNDKKLSFFHYSSAEIILIKSQLRNIFRFLLLKTFLSSFLSFYWPMYNLNSKGNASFSNFKIFGKDYINKPISEFLRPWIQKNGKRRHFAEYYRFLSFMNLAKRKLSKNYFAPTDLYWLINILHRGFNSKVLWNYVLILSSSSLSHLEQW